MNLRRRLRDQFRRTNRNAYDVCKHARAGKSSEDIAWLTGMTVESVRAFLANRTRGTYDRWLVW